MSLKQVRPAWAAIVIFVAMSVNTVSAELKSFSIPVGNMKPTLQIDDRFYVKHVSTADGSATSLKRGDVVTFTVPSAPDITYVMRIIGLPGDSLQMQNGEVILNGEKLIRSRVEDFEDRMPDGSTVKLPQFQEVLPNGRSYNTLDLLPNGMLDNTKEFNVPEGHVFVMGDNRDDSADSRLLYQIGYLPEKNVTGVVQTIYFSGPDQIEVSRPVEILKD